MDDDHRIPLKSDWRNDRRLAVFDNNSLARIQFVMDFWKGEGYEAVSLPWMAPEQAMAHTRPDNALKPEPATHEGALVSSAEQSFLWLDSEQLLPFSQKGYIGWTPCFRHEEKYNETHHHYFVKAELFIPVLPDEARQKMRHIMNRTALCWRALAISEGRKDLIPETVMTSKDSADLLLGGVELGSYGVRKRMLPGDEYYIYATAIAEPRWSHVWPK